MANSKKAIVEKVITFPHEEHMVVKKRGRISASPDSNYSNLVVNPNPTVVIDTGTGVPIPTPMTVMPTYQDYMTMSCDKLNLYLDYLLSMNSSMSSTNVPIEMINRYNQEVNAVKNEIGIICKITLTPKVFPNWANLDCVTLGIEIAGLQQSMAGLTSDKTTFMLYQNELDTANVMYNTKCKVPVVDSTPTPTPTPISIIGIGVKPTLLGGGGGGGGTDVLSENTPTTKNNNWLWILLAIATGYFLLKKKK